MRSLVLAVLYLALSAAPAQAQSPEPEGGGRDVDYKFEVFGILGWGRVGGDEGSRGSGPMFGGGVGVRPTARVGFEVEAGVLINTRGLPNSVRFEGNAVLISGNVLYHFAESMYQVYMIGGLGMLRTDQTVDFRDFFGGGRDSFRFVDTFAVWSGGLGLKAFVAPKLVVRPEIRYYGGGSLGVLGLPRVTVAFGYYW